MHLIVNPINKHYKVILLGCALTAIAAVFLLRAQSKQLTDNENFQYYNESIRNTTATNAPRKTQRKEYLYRLLTNTTRSLIQMEIKARRLEENMRRIKEKTADLLWKNKDKALWHILFKNISRHIAIRHEFHQFASLKRIMQDSHSHKHKMGRRKGLLEN